MDFSFTTIALVPNLPRRLIFELPPFLYQSSRIGVDVVHGFRYHYRAKVQARHNQCICIDPASATFRALNVTEILENIIMCAGTPHQLRYRSINKRWRNVIDSSPKIQHRLWIRRIPSRNNGISFETRALKPIEATVTGVCWSCSQNHRVPKSKHLNPLLKKDRRPWPEWVYGLAPHYWAIDRHCWWVDDDGALTFTFNSPLSVSSLTGGINLGERTASWRDAHLTDPPVLKVNIDTLDWSFWGPTVLEWACWIVEDPNGVKIGEFIDALRELRSFWPHASKLEMLRAVLWGLWDLVLKPTVITMLILEFLTIELFLASYEEQSYSQVCYGFLCKGSYFPRMMDLVFRNWASRKLLQTVCFTKLSWIWDSRPHAKWHLNCAAA
ncbi:hypothetical protein BU16DRAFT_536165 [Lophium mytilinum]|uniref:F-box domain-containing protein n=1 Tax=Lophium mytilinum TaxID=390894 RepID=A0A6A6R7P9_9PEZI|nr:hypothetical protein BU16DRAFT_536165 [Lophium mytilinum]